ncbi:DUF1963 domain-containing protein [Flagellimonas hadalis]|uniref:DUF1963 domain-containing protein n=1 Tax=Flagellimonas hadalis TaxID=2597517 RepID=A0A5N5IU30_9FLAO|nr:DUF1963 domain-containing protein [Allomuricauda hadalis]KAB5485443.1 DUF1963 domain-containing protein [Allomuricauda hadalis]
MYYKKTTEIIDDFLKRNKIPHLSIYLEASLTTYLDFKQTPINPKDEASVPLGTSKMYGLPHLPDSIDFPLGLHFIAQFNCSDLKPYDVDDILPENGIFYFFVDETLEGISCHYYDGPLDELKIQDYPVQEGKLPYEDKFKGQPRAISFEESEVIVLSTNVYWDREIGDLSLVLIDELKQALGDHIITIDDVQGHVNVLSGDYIFGKACFHQNEDHFDDFERHVLFFCFRMGEGHVNFFIRKGKLNPKKKLKKQIFAVYSPKS